MRSLWVMNVDPVNVDVEDEQVEKVEAAPYQMPVVSVVAPFEINQFSHALCTVHVELI